MVRFGAFPGAFWCIPQMAAKARQEKDEEKEDEEHGGESVV